MYPKNLDQVLEGNPYSCPLWPGTIVHLWTPPGSSQAVSPSGPLVIPEDSSGRNDPFAAQQRPIPCRLMMATATDQTRPLPQPSAVVSILVIPRAHMTPLQQQPPFDLDAFSSLWGFILTSETSHEDRHQMPLMPCTGSLMSSNLHIQSAISSPDYTAAASMEATVTP